MCTLERALEMYVYTTECVRAFSYEKQSWKDQFNDPFRL